MLLVLCMFSLLPFKQASALLMAETRAVLLPTLFLVSLLTLEDGL